MESDKTDMNASKAQTRASRNCFLVFGFLLLLIFCGLISENAGAQSDDGVGYKKSEEQSRAP
jgi:hypothetical protein